MRVEIGSHLRFIRWRARGPRVQNVVCRDHSSVRRAANAVSVAGRFISGPGYRNGEAGGGRGAIQCRP
ncbi:hypothetical protein DF011_02650 [Burkholderia ubonensis]|uniref:Uncharacterized protein n=1 Tax=Burkholderia ubonensis TaxID=101571 RepID=A0AB74DGN7_9BURK|nr:hypothetical protein DF013_05060 [Burkholderia ubonensis]RQP82683.1 hypothetical protein DF015_05025 [Burkholderia ubonensis]RQP90016.1 hypothetical protein DF014_02645 [Burkholderia ubonensis]RQP99253.1 hypothetical protein DF009_03120 [Burkholderia ubonensis]RQQ01538.1 hypothetical protein DF012_02685 [Burkholderia ubonensis]